MPPRRHSSRLTRALLMTLGVVALLLGLIGAFVPLLPTTPFILLAAACFARSATSIHTWLLTHPLAGPILQAWETHRSMPPGIKPWAFALMAASFSISIAAVPALWHRLMLGAILLGLGYCLWRIPVRPR